MRFFLKHRTPTTDCLISFLFLALTFFLLKPILGNVWYSMHDTTHVARLYLMEQTIRAGQFPPIWAEAVNNGFGYPLFHFYAPLFYYVALLLKLIVGSYFTALKLTLFSTIFLGMFGMYRLLKKWGRAPAILAGVAFGTLPYLAVDLYVRGAYSELLAMSLLPWLFYSWQNLSSRSRQITAGVITTLFLLSHNLIPLITFPFICIWIVLHHKNRLKYLIFPALLTLLLSAFYLLPLFFERSFVQADTVAKTTDYALHFVVPSQLWNSTWGFGGSALGIEDGFSFKVGKIPLLLALSSVGFLLLRRKRRFLSFFAFSALFSIFMLTSYSKFIWDRVGVLQIVQFPWRFLTLVGFFVSILAGLSLTLIKPKIFRILGLFFVVVCLLFINLKLFVPQTTFYPELSDFTGQTYLDTISSIIPEYQPRWLQETPSVPAGPLDRSYYPTWKVKVDGQFVPTSPSDIGLLSYPNPNNSSDVELLQSHTNLEKFGYFLTILGLISLLYYAKT